MMKVTDEKFYHNKNWDEPLIDLEIFRDNQAVDLFDQNGYRLTLLEQKYSKVNNQPFVLHRDEKSIRKVWLEDNNSTTGPHLNHAFLFERKGYEKEALNQLSEFAKKNHFLNKLINYKGKWGIDLSIDYVDGAGNSMELLHFEYDGYNLEEILEMKYLVETKITEVDWSLAAKNMIRRKGEWIDLEFFQQSKWKTDFFNLPSERFKILAWE